MSCIKVLLVDYSDMQIAYLFAICYITVQKAANFTSAISGKKAKTLRKSR